MRVSVLLHEPGLHLSTVVVYKIVQVRSFLHWSCLAPAVHLHVEPVVARMCKR